VKKEDPSDAGESGQKGVAGVDNGEKSRRSGRAFAIKNDKSSNLCYERLKYNSLEATQVHHAIADR